MLRLFVFLFVLLFVAIVIFISFSKIKGIDILEIASYEYQTEEGFVFQRNYFTGEVSSCGEVFPDDDIKSAYSYTRIKVNALKSKLRSIPVSQFQKNLDMYNELRCYSLTSDVLKKISFYEKKLIQKKEYEEKLKIERKRFSALKKSAYKKCKSQVGSSFSEIRTISIPEKDKWTFTPREKNQGIELYTREIKLTSIYDRHQQWEFSCVLLSNGEFTYSKDRIH